VHGQDLAAEGNAIGVKMTSLAKVNSALAAAHNWEKAAAAACAPTNNRIPYVTRPSIEEVLTLHSAQQFLLTTACNRLFPRPNSVDLSWRSITKF
jgi:hypothetical protein